LVERCLRQAALWDEVKDRLGTLGTKLSGGQQQRLTIARALSHGPEILCLDEFSIAIDPVTTMRIEEALKELRSRITIILVIVGTHGYSAVERLWLGSVSRAVASHAKCSVEIARLRKAQGADGKAMRILLAVDGSEFGDAVASHAPCSVGIVRKPILREGKNEYR